MGPGHEGVQGTATVTVPDVVDRGEPIWCELEGERFPLSHGAVVIAAITSCTNTSNPQVMVAAGLLALGLSMEIAQFVMQAGRMGDPYDMAANTGGVAAGLVVACVATGGWAERLEAWLAR